MMGSIYLPHLCANVGVLDVSNLILFVFVEGVGYCGFQTTGISWFQRVHHCHAGSSFNIISCVFLYHLVCKYSIFIYLFIDNEQLVSLAQAGHQITLDILKTTGKQSKVFWFSPFFEHFKQQIWTNKLKFLCILNCSIHPVHVSKGVRYEMGQWALTFYRSEIPQGIYI